MSRWVIALFGCVACGGQAVPAPAPVAIPVASASAAPSPAVPCSADEYHAATVPADPPPDLPPIPTLASTPTKIGDAFTVFGAIHALRSRYGSSEVTKGEITIRGYIVDSNVPRAPKCAWHKTGVADPPNCTTEIPSFILADSKDAKPDDPTHIKVLGWARNFPVVFDATAKYKGLTTRPQKLVTDDVWAVDVPYPIPARGMKVQVKGHYGFTFTKASSGMVADPKGVLTYTSLEVVE